MASIKISVDISNLKQSLDKKIAKIKDKEYLLKPVIFDLIDLMTKRIHYKGKKSDGTDIGKYSHGYLQERVKKYNRSNDRKVVISLTRQLENDWSLIATKNGYGIGFKNPFNLFKARHVEGGSESASVTAHTRKIKTKDGKIKEVRVEAHTRKGWRGYGLIFNLTSEERKYATELISELIHEALKG